MVIDFFAWLLFVATLIFIGLIFPVYTFNEVLVSLSLSVSNLVIKYNMKPILFTFYVLLVSKDLCFPKTFVSTSCNFLSQLWFMVG